MKIDLSEGASRIPVSLASALACLSHVGLSLLLIIKYSIIKYPRPPLGVGSSGFVA